MDGRRFHIEDAIVGFIGKLESRRRSLSEQTRIASLLLENRPFSDVHAFRNPFSRAVYVLCVLCVCVREREIKSHLRISSSSIFSI